MNEFHLTAIINIHKFTKSKFLSTYCTQGIFNRTGKTFFNDSPKNKVGFEKVKPSGENTSKNPVYVFPLSTPSA